ncbi:SH3 domain-containing protein [Myxacorys almedinensis]|uniref:SH3 domain-containing protein n=1 Tax=Myxacorys almedinensis A TaxID=2690445 RepID=A0A8J8CJP5_9CYAN|nr:SH3 domain-containing protein [Myxacorys almedinensis]NDJ18874.1 SH3 domain-containing protein [Myxacorys almedinensis A]
MKSKSWVTVFFSATAAVVVSISSVFAETVEVTVNNLNVRTGPGTNYPVLTVFDKGVRVNRIKQSGNWAYIVAGRVEGWVYSPYVVAVGSGDQGTGNGTITPGPGPAPSRYESFGSITNARFRGTGAGDVQLVGSNRVVVTATARGENIQPFSVTYYAAITNRSPGQIVANVTAFASSPTGNQTRPIEGECQIGVSSDSSFLRSFTCQAYGGVDHGRTVFTGR